MMNPLPFARIIEADIDELLRLLEPSEFAGLELSEELFYAKAIVHFHRGHFEELDSSIRLCQDRGLSAHLKIALELRRGIRKREVRLDLIEKASALADDDGMWQGELLILMATAMTILERHGEARRLFLRSALSLERRGSLRKAVRARSNALVAETHLDPSRHRIPEYMDLYRKAKSVGELAVAAGSLLNISREYQLMGSHLAALRYIDEALELNETNFGSLQNHLCRAHRAHLLLELNRPLEARIDIEMLAASSFPEVRAAVAVLEGRLGDPEGTQDKMLLPTWRERKTLKSEVKLSELENSLIHFLSEEPRTRHEIIAHLYGDLLDFEVRINRFKSLLGNLRKKSPDLIINDRGQYRLADSIFHQRKQRA